MPKISQEISMWFDYPDDPYNGRVHVRLLKQGEIDAIMEQSREIKTTFRKEFRQPETVMKLAGAKVGLAVASVKDWENFFDENDREMKCTRQNIEIMCVEDGFLKFVDECQDVLEKEADKRKKSEAKN